MGEYLTRLVDPADSHLLDRARALVREYLRGVHGDLTPWRMREQDAELLLDMASSKDSPVAVSLNGPYPVGVTVLHRYDGLAELRAAYVRPGHRRRGLGARMTDLLLGHADLLGLPLVFTVVAAGGSLDASLRRRGLTPAGPPPDGAAGSVRFDLPTSRHTRLTPDLLTGS